MLVDTLGRVNVLLSRPNVIFVAGSHRDKGKRYIVRANEKLTAFVELESAIRLCGE